MKWMMNNSKGKPDAMLTFAFVAFCVVSFVILGSMLKSVTHKAFEVEIATPDNTLLLGYLGATFGAYVARRNKEHVVEKKEDQPK